MLLLRAGRRARLSAPRGLDQRNIYFLSVLLPDGVILKFMGGITERLLGALICLDSVSFWIILIPGISTKPLIIADLVSILVIDLF